MRKHSFFSLALYFLSSVFFAFVSCNSDSKKATSILQSAENVVEQYPDSALVLLDSIRSPYELNQKQYAEFILRSIQAKDKAYKKIVSDTAIFDVKNYYVEKNDVENVALSTFYCGRVLQEQGKIQDAIAEYQKADKYAEKVGNTNLKGLSQSLIGEILLKELLPADAVEHFKAAAQFFHEARNVKDEIISYNLMGNAFLMNQLNDSAFYYYNKGLQLAKENHDNLQVAKINENIGVTYMQIDNYVLAEEYFRNAAKYIISNNDKIKLYINFSDLFYGRGMLDSAKVYADKSLSLLPAEQDIFVAASIYKTLSKIVEKQSDFKQSLTYYKEYAGNLYTIVDENKNKEILELQKKYDFEKIRNSNNQLIMKRQRTLIFLILIAVGMVIYIFYQRFIRNKMILMRLEQKIFGLQIMADEFSEKKNTFAEKENVFRKFLIDHFKIITKAASITAELSDDEIKKGQKLLNKFSRIIYGQDTLNWDKLYMVMNNKQNALYDKIQAKYPQLNETEFRILCLTCEKLDDIEIAIILDRKISIIRKIRNKVREEIGIPRYTHDFLSFLQKIIDTPK
jgi:DNA-binding CsgD family transcriptional regulator